LKHGWMDWRAIAKMAMVHAFAFLFKQSGKHMFTMFSRK
jgi:hypothetical protein